jgi:C4-dicarboxylate-specific signal transduction histidine kinase
MERPENVKPEDFLRLTALQELLGGVAHEINQPLNAIMIASQVIRLRVERSHLAEEQEAFLTERLDLISSQAQKAAQIIDNFRSLGDHDESSDTETLFRALFDQVLGLMGQQFISRGIDLICEMHDPASLIKGTPQVVRGIIVQALVFGRDAVQAIGGWHEKNGIAYKRILNASLSDEQGRCAFHLVWDRGQVLDWTALINPNAYAGLKAAKSILSSRGGGLKLTDDALRLIFPS